MLWVAAASAGAVPAAWLASRSSAWVSGPYTTLPCWMGLEVPEPALAVYKKGELFRRQTGN